jgi:carbon dioxide concentrating mechanism protein CcmO
LGIQHLIDQTLGIIEINGWTAAMVAADALQKAADVRVLQAEWNDMLGAVIKVTGSSAATQTAIEAGQHAAEAFNAQVVSIVIQRPDAEALRAIMSPAEYNPLIEQAVVKNIEPTSSELPSGNTMSSNSNQALGFIETQGFTAVFEAIDTACKAASVQVVGKEKLGGGYVTVVIRGDVAAVQAAIDAAKPRVEGLGKLIACHVIARPSESVMALLPK